MTTLSARGILASSADGKKFYDPARTRDVFDVSGAGDTVVAVISAAVASNANLEVAVALANHAAGVAVSKSGTAFVTPEILGYMPLTNPTEPASLARLCKNWRKAGDKIAFANGCLICASRPYKPVALRRKTDRLIIGLNSDTSVSRVRATAAHCNQWMKPALAAFDMVDTFAVFEQNTPQSLIALLQPDFIVKGGDYNPDDVVGSEI